MEVIQVASEIERRIKALETGRKQLQPRAEKKALAIAEYEKVIAKTIIMLHNDVPFELDGIQVINPPATTTEKIARGICWSEKLIMEQAEDEYKNAVVGLECLRAELQGYQSIFRFLDEK